MESIELNPLLRIRESLDELNNDGDCPQLSTIARCLNKIGEILVDEGF